MRLTGSTGVEVMVLSSTYPCNVICTPSRVKRMKLWAMICQNDRRKKTAFAGRFFFEHRLAANARCISREYTGVDPSYKSLPLLATSFCSPRLNGRAPKKLPYTGRRSLNNSDRNNSLQKRWFPANRKLTGGLFPTFEFVILG